MSIELNAQDFAIEAVTVFQAGRALVQRRFPVVLKVFISIASRCLSALSQ